MSKQHRDELKKQFTAAKPQTDGQAQQPPAVANSSTADEVRAAKRSKFLTEDKTGRGNALLYVLIPALLVVLLGGGFFLLRGKSSASSIPLASQLASQPAAPAGDAQLVGFIGGINSPLPNKQYPMIKAENDEIRIPTSIFDDRKAHFYRTVLPDGKPINFFVLKSSDGVIRAAIDSCDVCYAARKGYHQDGDEMVCNNCGLRFPSAKINEVKGGCNPAPLTRTVVGDSLVIKISDLVKDNRAANGQPLF